MSNLTLSNEIDSRYLPETWLSKEAASSFGVGNAILITHQQHCLSSAAALQTAFCQPQATKASEMSYSKVFDADTDGHVGRAALLKLFLGRELITFTMLACSSRRMT